VCTNIFLSKVDRTFRLWSLLKFNKIMTKITRMFSREAAIFTEIKYLILNSKIFFRIIEKALCAAFNDSSFSFNIISARNVIGHLYSDRA